MAREFTAEDWMDEAESAERAEAWPGPLKTWYCPKIFWGEKVLFSFRPLAGLSGRNARFGINTTS